MGGDHKLLVKLQFIETYTDNIDLNIPHRMIINKGAGRFYDFGRLFKHD